MPACDDLSAAANYERTLLAGMLASTDGLEDAIDGTAEADFAYRHHQHAFRAIVDLWESGEQATRENVFAKLITNGHRDEFVNANPAVFLVDIAGLDPTGAYAARNAKLVRAAAVRRRCRCELEVLHRDLDDGRPIEELLAAGEASLLGLGDQLLTGTSGPRPAREFMLDALKRIDERQASGGQLAGIATGLTDLDEVLNGLRPGELTIVAARPSVGKSAFALAIADHVAGSGTPVLFVSLEMPEPQLADRLLSMRSGIPMHRFTRGHRLTSWELERLQDSAEESRALPLHVEDHADRTATQVAAIARRQVRRRRVGLIIVDYLQLLSPENPRDNRTQQVGLSTRGLMRIARDCKVPVIALAQLNRDVESRPGQKPRLSDIRESGEIEQHAHTVLFLHRQPDQAEDAETWYVDVIAAKNRNGPTGEITLSYRRPVMRFENVGPVIR